MKKLNQFLNILMLLPAILLSAPVKGQIPGMRVLVITGGHDFDTNAFHDMFESMQGDIAYRIAALPEAFALFEPERRNAYDVIVMYHMWNIITPEQADNLADCIRQGMPLVVLHHSICAFDDWDEYRHITGGRYFHRPDTIDDRIYQVSSYQHDVLVNIHVRDDAHPVTRGMTDFALRDETYDDYYVEPGITPLLITDNQGSSPVIGWAKTYGRARVVTIQPGHDAKTFGDPHFRKLLLQAIQWVYQTRNCPGN